MEQIVGFKCILTDNTINYLYLEDGLKLAKLDMNGNKIMEAKLIDPALTLFRKKMTVQTDKTSALIYGETQKITVFLGAKAFEPGEILKTIHLELD